VRILRTFVLAMASLLLLINAFAQDPNAKHFAKDGLSFDYPANWQISDQSTQQMQYIQLARDGYTEIRIRVPREWLTTAEKEASARKLIQDTYVDQFVAQVEQAGLRPKRSTATTQISGGVAEGTRVRAMLDGEPGGMDSYFRIVSDRLVQLSMFGSEKEMAKSAPVWDLIRSSLAVEPRPQPKPTPQPSPAKGKP